MTLDYEPAQRALQDRHDTRRLADRLAEVAGEEVEPYRSFIEARECFFISTVDETGQPQCSYKGGDPGFVRVVDGSTIAFPVYDGNGMFLTVGNIVASAKVGLLFIDLEGGTRLRINGDASIDPEDPLRADHPGALYVVRVRARAVFPNCRRYVHRYALQEPSVFVPRGDDDPPVPDWKREPWFDGTLPDSDPAHDPEHPSAPSLPRF